MTRPATQRGRSLTRLYKVHRQGQALTEFIVIAAALVPLFLLIPVIAKYQDIAHTTQIASRYAAFDSLVRNNSQNTDKPIDQLQDEVRRRFFSTSDAPVKTKDVAGDFKAHQNLFWRTPDDKPLIENFSDITVMRSSLPAHDGNISGSMPGPFSFTYGLTGIGSANINVKLVNLPAGLNFYEPFDRINLSINRGTSVLADGWTGKSPQDVQDRFAGQVPSTKLLPPLSLIINPTMMLVEPGVSPPKLGQLDFWQDDVPEDRLRAP